MREAYRIYYLRGKESVQRFVSFAQARGYELGTIGFMLDDLTPDMQCPSLHDPKVPFGGDMGIIRNKLLYTCSDDEGNPTRLDALAKEFELYPLPSKKELFLLQETKELNLIT